MAQIWAGLGSTGQASVLSSMLGGGGGSAGLQSPSMMGALNQTGNTVSPTAVVSKDAINDVRQTTPMFQTQNQGFSNIFQNNQPLDPNSAYDEYIRRNIPAKRDNGSLW